MCQRRSVYPIGDGLELVVEPGADDVLLKICTVRKHVSWEGDRGRKCSQIGAGSRDAAEVDEQVGVANHRPRVQRAISVNVKKNHEARAHAAPAVERLEAPARRGGRGRRIRIHRRLDSSIDRMWRDLAFARCRGCPTRRKGRAI